MVETWTSSKMTMLTQIRSEPKILLDKCLDRPHSAFYVRMERHSFSSRMKMYCVPYILIQFVLTLQYNYAHIFSIFLREICFLAHHL